MSRVPGSFQLGRFTASCAADGRALVPGEPIVATLCDAPEGDESGHEFVRRDFAVDAWSAGSRPAGLVCFWRTTAPEPDQKRRLLVDVVLLVTPRRRLLVQRAEGLVDGAAGLVQRPPRGARLPRARPRTQGADSSTGLID